MSERNIHILLIEDNPGDIRLMEEFLSESTEIDFHLSAAMTLKEGIALYSQQNFDVLLLDLSLPDSKGLKTLAKTQDKCPGIPIIVFTGNDDLSVSKQAIRDGAQDFLIKGKFDSDLLVRAISYAIQRYTLESRLREYSERLKKAQKVGHTGSWEIDLATMTVWASEEAHNIYSLPYQENNLSFKQIQGPPLPEFRKSLDKALDDLIKLKTPYDIEFKIKRSSDGEIRWIHSVAELVTDNFGRPGKVCGVIQDITESKKAEEKLKESERLYKLIADNSSDTIWTMDLQGKFTYVSPSVIKLCGYTAEELMELPLEKVVTAGSYNLVKDLLQKRISSISTGAFMPVVVVEVEQKCKDGSSVWVEIVSDNIKDETGNIVGILGASRNISERKKMQDELRDSKQRFWDMFNNAPFGYHELNMEGRIAQVNQTELDMLGYSHNEMVTSFIWDFIDDRESSQDRVLKKLQGAIPPGVGTERQYRKKDGSILTLLVEDRLIIDNKGAITGMRSAVQDITARKEAENEIIKLSMAVEQSPASIVITDVDGNIEYVNHTFTATTGYDFIEVIHKNPRLLQSGHTTKEEYKKMWETILSGNTWTGEFLNIKKNKDLYWEEAIISPSKDKSGLVTNFIAIKRDVTEYKKINEELLVAKETAEEMSRLKSSFLANMSHELRTPMIGILGYSEILVEETEDEKIREIGGIMLKSGRRLMETLNLILDLSRIEAKKLEIELSSMNIIEIIESVITLFRAAADKKNLTLTLDSSFESLDLMLDKKLFREAINNLVNNAIKFTNHGDISIKISKEEIDSIDWAVIKVIDTGIGIARGNLDLIFEEFRQASEGTSRSFEGTGLGLTITKKFVEKLHGVISVQSTLDVGSIFTLRFPMHREEEKPQQKNESVVSLPEPGGSPETASKIPTVLYVEDDLIAVALITRMLEDVCVIESAISAKDALIRVKKKMYTAILMDINLGKGLDGVETTKLIREIPQYAHVPIIAVTAFAMVGDAEEFLRAGCSHYLSKPFTKIELTRLMQDVFTNTNR